MHVFAQCHFHFTLQVLRTRALVFARTNTDYFVKLSLKGHCLVIISCFHDYGQELALSLLYFLKKGRKKSPKAINAEKYELNRQNSDYKTQNSSRMEADFDFLTTFCEMKIGEL